jgi:hypothetical protein
MIKVAIAIPFLACIHQAFFLFSAFIQLLRDSVEPKLVYSSLEMEDVKSEITVDMCHGSSISLCTFQSSGPPQVHHGERKITLKYHQT